jgi:hypothetical protein
MLFFTKTKLGFSEKEFWRFTLRKYIALRDLFLEDIKPQEEQEVFADNVL